MKPIFDLADSSVSVIKQTRTGVIKSRYRLIQAGTEKAFAQIPLTLPPDYLSGVIITCEWPIDPALIGFLYNLKYTLGTDGALGLVFPTWNKQNKNWLKLIRWLGYTRTDLTESRIIYTYTFGRKLPKPKRPLKLTSGQLSKRTCKTWLETVATREPQPKFIEVNPTTSRFGNYCMSLGYHPCIILYRHSQAIKKQLLEEFGKDD